MAKVNEISQKHYQIISELHELPVSADWFNPKFWEASQSLTGTSKGRNVTHFFQYQQQEYVLRHYFRGGLIGRLIHDQYLFLGLEQTRAYAELKLLERLQGLRLPVPGAVAARVQRKGLFYRADIIMEKIPDAQDAFHILQRQSLNQEQWFSIGATIREFHRHNVYHADLNIHNIMIDQHQKSWLIDFDRGAIRTHDNSWQQSNLERLLRSLRKEKSKLYEFYWSEHEWQYLLNGYND